MSTASEPVRFEAGDNRVTVKDIVVEVRQDQTTEFDTLTIPCDVIDVRAIGTWRNRIIGHYHHECPSCGTTLDLTLPFTMTTTIEVKPKPKRKRWFRRIQ